jgi:hypothetical protein
MKGAYDYLLETLDVQKLDRVRPLFRRPRACRPAQRQL